MTGVAAELLALRPGENPVFTHVTATQPESYPGCRLGFGDVKGGGEVGGRLGVIFPCGSSPGPALILTSNINLLPESLHLPIPLHVEIGHIDRAAALFDFFQAVKTLSHQAEVALVPWEVFSVPGAFDLICHVNPQVVLSRLLRITGSEAFAHFLDGGPEQIRI
jgi:hypothetical protein